MYAIERGVMPHRTGQDRTAVSKNLNITYVLHLYSNMIPHGARYGDGPQKCPQRASCPNAHYR
jgi:hypothetical protein